MENKQRIVNDILDSMDLSSDEKDVLNTLIYRLIDDNFIVDYTDCKMKSLDDLERELYAK